MSTYSRKNKSATFIALLPILLSITISTADAQFLLDRARDRADERYEDRQDLLDRIEDRAKEEQAYYDEDQDRYDRNDEIPAKETVESESQSDEECTVQQVLKLKDAGLSDNQIQDACE